MFLHLQTHRRAARVRLSRSASSPNEVERLKAVEHSDVEIFPRWAAEQQKKYVLLARNTFNTPFAAISYVSRTHEVLSVKLAIGLITFLGTYLVATALQLMPSSRVSQW
jgi:hypothetical protein